MSLLLLALLSSTLTGYLATRVFLPVYKPVWADLTLKISLGAGVGVGFASCMFFLARLLLGPSRIVAVIAELVLLVAAGLAFWFARDTLVVDKPTASPHGWTWLLLAAMLGSLAIAVTVFADSSSSNAYGLWDAWSIWNLRARFLAQPDGSWRRAFSPALSQITHPEYPMLLSGYIARCWSMIGSIGETAVPIAAAVLFSGATLGLIVSALAILRGWITAMAGGIILLGSIGFLIDGPWQYADVPLAFFYLAAFATLFLADAERERRGRIAVLAGLAVGFAAWTKDEGLLFALIFGLAIIGYLFMAKDRPRWSTLQAFAAGAAAPLTLVLLFRLFLAPPIITPVTVGGAAHQIAEGNRYLQIARAFWNEGVAMGSGIAHPMISLGVLAACLGIPSGRRRQPVVIASSFAWLAIFVGYFFAYVITPKDLTWHLETSLGRLYVQLWPSFIFLSLAALRTVEETATKVQQPREVAPAQVRKSKKGGNKVRATLIVVALACSPAFAAQTYDVVVYGGTPGGVASAISAARLGHTVALLEYHPHIGGMSGSGLGKSDIETREAIGGMFREFVDRVHKFYIDNYGAGSENVKLCRDGYYFEPSVAERIFEEMVAAESRIRLFKNHRLDEVIRSGARVTGIRATNRSTGAVEEFRGKVFIDGTYEGDLAAYAGARYRVGREGRAEFNELHAGVVYQDPATRTFLAGTTGEGDKRIQAYTFRLCLTTDPANSYVMRDPPPEYDRTRYLGYVDDWKAGRMGNPEPNRPGSGTMLRAFTIAPIPNGKTDLNMWPKALAYPFAEENFGYPEADWEQREKITARIRNITLGLLYFLQNDPVAPAEHRKVANQFHLSKDEFADNGHFPWQLYVREARRIIGLYTLSEKDVTVGLDRGRPPIHPDSIAAGEYPIDSMPTRKKQPGDDTILEGYLFMLKNITRPYQIPYRIIVPEEVDSLLVPVAASTTHVAFSSIRLEPTWMALGHAAGMAAHLAIAGGTRVREVNVDRMQRLLLGERQVLTYFKDIDHADPAYAALQYFGTKGFFRDYMARSKEPLDKKTAEEWLRLARGLGLTGDSPSAENTTRGEFCRALYQRLEGRAQ